MAVELVKEKWTGKINEVTIGATKEQGGTRTSVVTIGGETAMSFMHFEGEMPRKPVIAIEVLDMVPDDWAKVLTKPYEGVLDKPGQWAKKCVEEFKADIIFLRLQSIHPDFGNTTADKAVAAVKDVISSVGVPVIIYGSGNADKDNDILPKCSNAVHGENCLFGKASQDNYRTLAATCLADGHTILAEAPIDVNIQKQVNILVTEMGFPSTKIIMDPTTGALGYGLEYTYSVMERIRLAALSGDKMLSMPFLCLIGQEAWKSKEAKALQLDQPVWGDENKRGPAWEIVTGTALLLAGADILVARHPESVFALKNAIDKFMKK